jgi:recombinational DNA repair ATPase RecF
LLKVAQLQELATQRHGVILLDDFMTDFDPKRAEILLELLGKTGSQLIVTSPSKNSHFDDLLLKSKQAQHIILTN